MDAPARPTVLVTGGSGFLGRSIVACLLAGGFRVRSLQRGSMAGEGVDAHQGDVRDPEAVARAMRGCSSVIHAAGLAHVFAGQAQAPFDDVNARGTEIVARAAAAHGVDHLILVGSVSVYGGSDRGGAESCPCAPRGPYAESKAAAETRAVAATVSSGTRLTILRLATLYGEGDRGNVQRLISAIARRRFVWIGEGRNRKSLIHVDDAARACVAALDRTGAGVEVFNVSGPPVTMRAIVDAIGRELGRAVPGWRVPPPLAHGAAAAAALVLPGKGSALRESIRKWLDDDVYPSERFNRRFGFEPRVSLDEGIARQVAAWKRPAG